MNHVSRLLGTIGVLLAAVLCGCSTGTSESRDSHGPAVSQSEHDHSHEGGEHSHEEGEHDRRGRGEHDRDSDDHHAEEGEESGAEFGLTDTYDEVRNGARLILAFDARSGSFQGTVENTTDKVLERVRVEVHLSNGRELGPTTPADLEPGEKREVKLTPESKDFKAWSAHPEVGNEEHRHGDSHGEEEGEEHDREAR